MHVRPRAHAPDKENWDPFHSGIEKQLHSATKEKTLGIPQHIRGNMQFAALVSTTHSLAPSAIIKIYHRKTFQHTLASWRVVYT